MKALLLIIALTGCSLMPTFHQSRSSTVLITTGQGLGSGVVINGNCVVTADHVVHDAPDGAVIMDAQENFYDAKTTAEDTDRDVAVLCSSQTMKVAPVTMASHMPDIYSTVYTIGYPFGKKLVLTEGEYEGDEMISAPCAPGNSGGGVFNSDGQYIGLADNIAMSRYGAFAHLCGIVEIDAIRAFLEEKGVKHG